MSWSSNGHFPDASIGIGHLEDMFGLGLLHASHHLPLGVIHRISSDGNFWIDSLTGVHLLVYFLGNSSV